jgi:sacsin
VIYHNSGTCQSKQSNPRDLLAHEKAILRTIPLWPSCDATFSELISARDVLIIEQGFIVPWMKQYAQFMDPQFAKNPQNQNCFHNLGMDEIPIGKLLQHILPIPSNLSDENWQHYQTLVKSISMVHKSMPYWPTVRSTLIQSKIAGDKNRLLHTASELFDHEDPIFVSAFREKEVTNFLHNDVRSFRQLWLNIGLRHRENGSFHPADYRKCIQEMSTRLNITISALSDSQLESDSRTVLSPLVTPGSSIQRFVDSDWLAISTVRVFKSRTVHNTEPVYRQRRMEEVVANQRLLSLSEMISYTYVTVCWSQTSFASLTPTNEVFSKVRGNGKPPLAMVWRHLDYLRELAQSLRPEHISDFLSDLRSTYTYLQDNLDGSRTCFTLKDSAIWLNINSSEGDYTSLDSVKSSWNVIADLVLSSSCDAGPVKAVRPNLMRYEKLLRALGCASITYPTVTRPTLHLGHSLSTSLRSLRDQGKLLDVTYSTEGRLIKAHRVVLAAVSDKCAAQFNGPWAVEDPIKYNEDDDPETYLSYHSLSTMIKFAYDDEVDWTEMEVREGDNAKTRGEKLHLLLDLHKGADIWLIPALKSQIQDKILLAGNKFLDIQNVEKIRQRAEEVGAKAVVEMCVKFIKDNEHTVERANRQISS